ncbi:MAG: CorA family divalent cation transporter [Acidobacteriota bacterium]
MHINEVLMRKKRRDRITRRNPPGAAPGTISVDPEAPKPVIRVIAYGPDQIEESQIDDLDAVQAFMDRHPVTWVNVDGLGDAGVLSSLAARFNLHKLAMEDVVNVHQRAKVERYRDNLFIVARMAMKEVELSSEQVSLFLGKGFVLTFQERPGDCLACGSGCGPARDKSGVRGRITWPTPFWTPSSTSISRFWRP